MKFSQINYFLFLFGILETNLLVEMNSDFNMVYCFWQFNFLKTTRKLPFMGFILNQIANHSNSKFVEKVIEISENNLQIYKNWKKKLQIIECSFHGTIIFWNLKFLFQQRF
jgi:hypothetical protein